mgnify:CR=1 FL=1
MLISISSEIISLIAENRIPEEQLKYLTKSLANVVESSENILSLKKNPKMDDTYYSLLNHDSVADRLKEIIRMLTNQFQDTSTMYEYVNRYIEITFNRTEFHEENGIGILYLSLEYVYTNKLNLQNPIKILGEDDSDSEFFKDLGELYGRYNFSIDERKDMYYDTLRFKIGTSAGGNIATRIVTEVARNKEITIAIADSDIKYEGGEYGETAKKLLEGKDDLVSNFNNHHFEAMILSVHEKENLIKPSEYQSNGLTNPYIRLYCSIEQNGNLIKYLKYLDYKSGMEKYYNELDDQNKIQDYNSFYSTLEGHFPEYKRFNLGRKCISNIEVSNLDFSEDDIITSIRRELSKVFWSWGVSKNEQYLKI